MKVTKKFVKIVLIILATIIVLGLVLEFAVLRTSAWTKLPAYWRTQVAFIKLEEVANDASCRESCVFVQAGLENMITDYLVRKPGVFDEQIERYIKNGEVSLDFKSFLIRIVAKAERQRAETDTSYEVTIPDYLEQYLEQEGTDSNVRAQILSNFYAQLGGSEWLVDDLIAIIKDKSKSIDERIPAMMDLNNIIVQKQEEGDDRRGKYGFFTPKYQNIDYPGLAEMFLSFAEDKNEDDQLRYASLDGLSITMDFENIYSEGIFDRLVAIFNDRDNHLGIRDNALGSIGFYGGIFNNNEAIKILGQIYNDKEENIYLNYNAWIRLNKIKENTYPEPVIEDSIYDKYLNEAFRLSYTRKSYLE